MLENKINRLRVLHTKTNETTTQKS